MAYIPTFYSSEPETGIQALMAVSTTQNLPIGTIVRGLDPNLGAGEFIYLLGVASTAAGDFVTWNGLTGQTTRWAGTVLLGSPLAVALTANPAASYGWYQISGNAVGSSSGTVAQGDQAYWNAAAQVKSAVVASKQVVGAVASTANNATVGGVALGTGFSVYAINRPVSQPAIT